MITIADRALITVMASGEPDDTQHLAYNVTVNGTSRGVVSFAHYYLPAIGVYANSELAVWAGGTLATGSLVAGPLNAVTLPEPLLAVFRLRAGWLAVADISVYVLDQSLTIVHRSIHDEVILDAFWEDGMLVLRDLQNRMLTARIEEESMRVSDLQPYGVGTPDTPRPAAR